MEIPVCAFLPFNAAIIQFVNRTSMNREKPMMEAIMELRAYLSGTSRGLVIFEWNLVASNAMLQITELPSESKYEEVRDQFADLRALGSLWGCSPQCQFDGQYRGCTNLRRTMPQKPALTGFSTERRKVGHWRAKVRRQENRSWVKHLLIPPCALRG